MRLEEYVLGSMMVMACVAMPCQAAEPQTPGALKVHSIFNSNMVIQRGKPIKVWGWAKPGDKVAVKFGEESAKTEVGPAAPVEVFGKEADYAGKGRWEVICEKLKTLAGPTENAKKEQNN